MIVASNDPARAYAGLGEVAAATGAVAVARSFGPTLMRSGAVPSKVVAGGSAALGLAAGLAGEGLARGLDAATPLDRFQSHALIGVAGAVTALAGARIGSGAAKIAGSIGGTLAVTGAAGAALDVAHAKFDTDADGRFLPEIPTAVKLGAAGVIAGGAAIKFGPKAMTMLRNSKQLTGSASQMDDVGAKLGELIPRSKLTSGPQVFLGARIEHGHGAKAIRTIVPHQLDAPALRTSLGMPATGALSADELASIGVRSLEKQGAFALDDAGRPLVDMILEGSPTGTGGLNIAPVMMAEQLARTATVGAQYGAKPSIMSLGKVDEAIDAFVAVSKANRDRVAMMPAGARPPRYGIATSLGGLQFDELVRAKGPGIIDELGLEKIVTLGAPTRMSKLDPKTLPEGFHIRATFDEFAKLSDDVVDRARFIELRHADDPVPLMSFDLAVRRPEWFADSRRFTPGVSLLQHADDVTASISRGTGPKVSTGGHEYREIISNEAFARAIGLRAGSATGLSDDAIRTAATRAQDTAVSEAKRIRDTLMGTAPKPA